MSAHPFPTFPETLTPGFRFKVQPEGESCRIECSGTLDVRDASTEVQSELLRLHDALVASRVHSVRLDMHGVDYMNSSGIQGFMAWFLKAGNAIDHRYTIEVIYDPDRRWQVVSFPIMERLTPGVLRVRAADKPGG